jgi:hypothetical protein
LTGGGSSGFYTRDSYPFDMGFPVDPTTVRYNRMEITYRNVATNLFRDTLIDVTASSSEYDLLKVAEEWPKFQQIRHLEFQVWH